MIIFVRIFNVAKILMFSAAEQKEATDECGTRGETSIEIIFINVVGPQMAKTELEKEIVMNS